MRRFLVFVAWLAVSSPQIYAQHGGGMHMGGIVSARPALVAAPVGHHAAVAGTLRVSTGTRLSVRPGAMRTHVRGTGTLIVRANKSVFRRLDDDDDFSFPFDFFGAPGLGFDATHFFAVHPRIFGSRRFGRFNQGFFGGGFLFPPSVIIEQAAPAEKATAEEVIEEPAAQESGRRILRNTYEPQTAEAPAPLKAESDEYVFVRRDGTVFFAVAYSWENETLRYITQEGLRRSATRDVLDLAATQQFNEQRGLMFRLPA